jgi:hypothetical protein
MLQHWVAILALAGLAAVLLSVLVIGPGYPNLFAVMFVIAMAGLGFAVMTLQVAEYRAANPPRDTLVMEGEVSPAPPNSIVPSRPGMGAAAPPAARNPYIAETRQQP